MSQIEEKIKSTSNHKAAGHYVFDVRKSSTEKSEIYLVFPDGTEFALLNTHTTKVLADVIDLPSIQLEAYANLTTLYETIGRATKASDATLRVNINLYGSQETRKDVGRQLSSGKIYLQHPDQRRPGSIYDNPHFLGLPGMQVEEVDSKQQHFVENVLQGNDSNEPGQFQKAVSDVYASLKRSSHLKRVDGDTRLRTTLLP